MDPKASRKKQRVTAGEGMSDISKSMHDVADSVSAVSLSKRETLQVFAIKAIEEEGDLSPAELADVVVCVMRDAEFANAYIAVQDSTMCAIILRHQLENSRCV
jgi:hypothetical protein